MIQRAILVVTYWSVVLTSLWMPSLSQVENGDSKPCPDEIDEDVANGFDFIHKIDLDKPGVIIPGVRKVIGSNKYATAFSISPEADLKIPTRSLFPKGVPDQFSFVATLRLKGTSTVERWDLIRIEDTEGEAQFGIALDGLTKEIEMYMPEIRGDLQVITFSDSPSISQLFDGQWHKLEFSSTRDRLNLYLDCQLVASEEIDDRGPVDIDGDLYIASKEDGTSATIDLQWLMMHCDPSKPKTGRCDDIERFRTTKAPVVRVTTRRTTTPKPTTERVPRITTKRIPIQTERFTTRPTVGTLGNHQARSAVVR